MSVYLVTGKLGSGKTLSMVGRIQDYLKQGRAVATNLDLNLHVLTGSFDKSARVTRLPDKPVVEDLENLPNPYEGDYDENKSGCIVLDECGTWFNTRNFQDKKRQPLINKLLHIRKAGWDVYFIVQHIEMIDKQVREGLGEHVVTCQRMDRLGVPFITGLAKLFGKEIRLPKVHMALVHYGTSQFAPLVDRWVYMGKHLYNAYDTRQVFGASDCQLSSYLPSYYYRGRYTTLKAEKKKRNDEIIQEIKKYIKGTDAFFLAIGLLFGYSLTPASSTPIDIPVAETVQQEPENKETEKPIQKEEFADIRIQASIKIGNKYEYYFYDTLKDENFYFDSSYIVRAIDECASKIIGLNKTYTIRC
jgi:hypothetical protein